MKMRRGSEISTFQACRRKWKYEWIDNLVLIRPSTPKFFGTVMHKFIQVLNETRDWDNAFATGEELMREKGKELDPATYQELAELYATLTIDYHKMWDDSKRKTLFTELTFRVRITDTYPTDDWYTGTVDHIFLDEHGMLWIEDHKNVKRMDSYITAAQNDAQITRYLGAVTLLLNGQGEILVNGKWEPFTGGNNRIEGLVYNLLSKSPAHPPKKLSKGGLSVDKSQRTTFALYIEALKEHGLFGNIQPDPEHEGHYLIPSDHPYHDFLVMLSEQEGPDGNRFFKRIKARRTPQELQTAFNEMEDIFDDMDRAEREQRFYRNPTHNCNTCDMRHLCFAEASGENATYIRQTMYMTNPDRVEDDEDADTESS